MAREPQHHDLSVRPGTVRAAPATAPQVEEGDDGKTLIKFGERVQIERRAFRPKEWVLYELKKIEPAADGKRRHPVHGAVTDMEEVWMIRAEGTREEMMKRGETLATSLK